VKQPGITAIAHPASLEVATTHGVFVLQEMEDIVQTYRKSEELRLVVDYIWYGSSGGLQLQCRQTGLCFKVQFCCVVSDPDKPSTMGVVRSFLHKVSKERMIAAGAKIPDREQVSSEGCR